jgi:hypothetical protein
MANYYAKARSNYFKVKDIEKFQALCNELNVEMIKRDNLVGFICTLDPDCGGLPSSKYNEETEDHDEIDISQEIYPHLCEGEVAVMMEAGYEKYRYVNGYALAVNWKGEEESISINNIYELANKNLGGKDVTRAEY